MWGVGSPLKNQYFENHYVLCWAKVGLKLKFHEAGNLVAEDYMQTQIFMFYMNRFQFQGFILQISHTIIRLKENTTNSCYFLFFWFFYCTLSVLLNGMNFCKYIRKSSGNKNKYLTQLQVLLLWKCKRTAHTFVSFLFF